MIDSIGKDIQNIPEKVSGQTSAISPIIKLLPLGEALLTYEAYMLWIVGGIFRTGNDALHGRVTQDRLWEVWGPPIKEIALSTLRKQLDELLDKDTSGLTNEFLVKVPGKSTIVDLTQALLKQSDAKIVGTLANGFTNFALLATKWYNQAITIVGGVVSPVLPQNWLSSVNTPVSSSTIPTTAPASVVAPSPPGQEPPAAPLKTTPAGRTIFGSWSGSKDGVTATLTISKAGESVTVTVTLSGALSQNYNVGTGSGSTYVGDYFSGTSISCTCYGEFRGYSLDPDLPYLAYDSESVMAFLEDDGSLDAWYTGVRMTMR